jgi:hypothetical protein
VAPAGSAPLRCLHEGCNAKSFKRHADLSRHYSQLHGSDQDKKSRYCDYALCSRVSLPFHRLDHCRGHYREYHREDIPKLGASWTLELDWLTGRSIDKSWWRCAKCLARVRIAESQFRCPTCASECASTRREVRGFGGTNASAPARYSSVARLNSFQFSSSKHSDHQPSAGLNIHKIYMSSDHE